jgi:membrane protease YdiL (CAAX protease family)
MKNAFHNFSPFAQVLFLVALGFLFFAIFSMLLSSIAAVFFDHLPLNDIYLLMEEHSIAFMVLFYVPFQAGLFLLPGLLYYYVAPSQFKWNVFKSSGYGMNILWSILLFLSLFLLLPFLAEFNIEITKWLGIYEVLNMAKIESDETLIKLFGEGAPKENYITALIIIGVLTGIAEEFAFRGFLLRHLIRTTNKKWLAIITSGLVFALLHFNYLQIIPLIAFGVALGVIYVVTKSIWLGIALHAANNIINISWLHQGDFPEWMETSTYIITLPAILLLAGLLFWKRKSIRFTEG